MRATRTSSGWSFSLISDLPPGDHPRLLAADGDHYALAAVKFKRSHPLNVAVSNDWDTGDPDRSIDCAAHAPELGHERRAAAHRSARPEDKAKGREKA